MLLKELRKEVISIALRAKKERLVKLTMGNFSLRDKESGYICITPSGMEYSILKARDIVVIDTNGNIIEGERKPSIETPLHCAAYKIRSDVFGVAHTHSTFATAWASCNENLPVVIAEIANHLAGTVLCSPYKRPGTPELAEITAEYLKDRNAVLMGNHGVLAVGEDLESAYTNAVVVEEGAKIAYYARQIGDMKILSDEECTILRQRTIEGYGQK